MAMETLIHKIYACGRMLAFVLAVTSFASCGEEMLDFDNPDVEIFVRQLKEGKLGIRPEDANGLMPKFEMEDIEDLLEYADDMSAVPAFPLAPVSYSAGGKLRLGECILWTIETIRLGHIASMGCKMVHVDAEDYEGIYFLSDEEVRDAVQFYHRWWKNREHPQSMQAIGPCYDEPLCGSGYMWW